MKIVILSIILVIIITACSSSSMSVNQSSKMKDFQVHRLAIAPGSGVFGEVVALELFNLGVNVVDPNEAAVIVGRAGLTEFEVTSTKGYSILSEKGIDAILVCKAAMSYDGTPESASIRISSTQDGSLIAGIIWENGWGGVRGSLADRSMRDNLSEAAQEIAAEMVKRFNLRTEVKQ